MLLTLTLILPMLFAHEELQSLVCKNSDHNLTVRYKKPLYDLSLASKGQIVHSTKLSSIVIHDEVEPKSNQITDVYTAKEKEFTLEIKRPETPGPLKSVEAKLSWTKPSNTWTFKKCKLETQHPKK